MGFGFRILFLEGELGRGEDCISRVASQDPLLAITQDLPDKATLAIQKRHCKKGDDTKPPTPKKSPADSPVFSCCLVARKRTPPPALFLGVRLLLQLYRRGGEGGGGFCVARGRDSEGEEEEKTFVGPFQRKLFRKSRGWGNCCVCACLLRLATSLAPRLSYFLFQVQFLFCSLSRPFALWCKRQFHLEKKPSYSPPPAPSCRKLGCEFCRLRSSDYTVVFH